MFAVEKLSSYITQGVYTVSGPFHPFGGAVDIIVVQQPDGSFKSSPWNVRFGKFQGVLKTKEKVVKISVNGIEANFHMYLSHKGEAYFSKEVDNEEENSVALSTQSSMYEADDNIDQNQNVKLKQSKSCDLGSDLQSSVTQIDAGSQKIVMTTNSNRSQIFGFMFGRKSVDYGVQEERNGSGLEETNCLDHAAIAADLLEVNWSTNLSMNREKRSDKPSILSSSSLPVEVYKDFEVSDENYSENCVLSESISLPNEGVGNHLESIPRNTNAFEEASSPSGSCLESKLTLEENVSNVVISEKIIENDQLDIGNGGFVGNKNDSLSEVTPLHAHNPHSDELEEDQSNMQCCEEESFDKINDSSNCGMSDNEGETLQIQYQSSEILGEAVDIPDYQGGLENAHPPHYGCEVSVVNGDTEVSYGTAEKLETESEIVLTTNNSDDSCLLSREGSYDTLNTKNVSENEVKSSPVEAKIMYMESDTLGNRYSKELDSSLVIHQETVVDVLNEDKTSDKEQDEGSRNQSPVSFSNSCLYGNITLERSFIAPDPHYPEAAPEQSIDLNEEVESGGICVVFSPSYAIRQDEEEENHDEENKMNTSVDFVDAPQGFSTDYLPAELPNSSFAPSESSDEEQFLFSDNEDFITSGDQQKSSVSPDPVDISPVILDDEIGDISSTDINHVPYLSTDEFAHESSLSASQPLVEESNATSPISIQRSQKGTTEESKWAAQSMPNLRSCIDNLEASDDLLPLSHSFSSSSENLESKMLRKDISCSFKLNSDAKSPSLEGKFTVDDPQFLEGLKDMSTNPLFETSLCKHLLNEGMGIDAASQAFDAEKVDYDKFVSLAPELVKDERLVIRIGGQYFPWEAASPIIVEMVSFGHEHISESKGMIAVDRVEETLEDDASNTNVSGGSWRIWPFTFKKSTSLTSVQSAQDGAKDSEADNPSQSNGGGITRNNSSTKVNGSKRKVRSTIPTSEQLDTLNLKAGQNMVTFTFSTAMLGKQQVDARIYLWKWNTRVVISDVDGTITKSDVLGQFMPLVGKDWSQTGVAHLFSAIKENGYQLLFLSARAISQAYLTRQFLLNLKQDGKALPDGPVVISPDGLFPSLFREVIRRAPHEFKIACLNDIKALFPPDCNPFYAGFGNRDTDEFSYLKVGIPKGKIFIINPKGEVAVHRRVDTKSYTSLHELVNGMFPPTSAEPEEYNTWNYWKMPFPEIDL